MANPTTYFGWVMPTATDLVTDLPADFNVFGQGVDTSMQDLLGGTTGQVLSKTSATNMDFTWVTPQVGDITEVAAGTGISGGGSSGSVTITNSMATAIDAKGDLIGGTGADTFTRLAVGANDTVLTADSTAATGMKWAVASSSGGMTSIASGSLSGASLVLSSISGSYKNLRLVLRNYYAASDFDINIKCNALTTAGDYSIVYCESTTTNNTSATWTSYYNTTVIGANNSLVDNTDGDNSLILDISDYAETTAVKNFTQLNTYKRSTGQRTNISYFGSVNTTSAITTLTVTPTANWSAGTYVLYGVN